MLAGSDRQSDDDLVFAQANGHPLDKKRDYDDWCRLLERAGVRHVRLHNGRHTAATLLLSEGVHPRVVMELLGHSEDSGGARTSLLLHPRCESSRPAEAKGLQRLRKCHAHPRRRHRRHSRLPQWPAAVAWCCRWLIIRHRACSKASAGWCRHPGE
jgi:hypothetical protein